ncbi:hypothetical protein KMT30_06760 [Streptomyces sp. IBSBF 2953]|nr:hypothetical protein [Streptomyces hayashii]
MRHAVITPDGTLSHHDGEPDWQALIGVEGKTRVRLHSSLAVAGWVNDVGLLRPKDYPFNVVGSCVLASLGANVQPYNGNVVFTGWNPANTPLGLLEMGSLPKPVEFLDTVHGDVHKALAGLTPRELSPSWAEQMREVAEHCRTAPTPTLTVRPVRF